MRRLGWTGLRPVGHWHEVGRLWGFEKESRSLGGSSPHSPHLEWICPEATCPALPALLREHRQPAASASSPPGLGCLCSPCGAERCSRYQGWWEDPGYRGDYSGSQNAIPENVGRGPLQPLWGRRPFIRRKTIRNRLSIGAKHPGVRSATCGSLAVRLKVAPVASEPGVGSLASHHRVLGSTCHREAPFLHPALSRLRWATCQPDLTPTSLVPFIHHLGCISAASLLN